MTVEIPTWLTKNYIQNAFQNGKDYSVTIHDFEVDMAVPKGNNFVCNVYRVSVKYTNSNDLKYLRTKSLIIKEPIYGPIYDSVTKMGIETEVKFYNIVAPKVNQLFGVKDDDSEEDDIVIPRSYFSSEKNVIILEDLKTKGYVLGDRVNRFDYAHSIVTVKALAKFHAGTKITIDEDPRMIELFKWNLSAEETKKKFARFYMGNFKYLADEFKKRPDLAKYTDWLYKNYETGFDKAYELMLPKENEFTVLHHGDFSIQNFLIKYTDNIPTKLLPIDYQSCRCNSPIVDFFYLTELNIQEDVRNNKFDELVHIYVTEVNSHLEKYGSNSRLEESEFRRYIEDRSYLRVFLTVSLLSLAVAMPAESKIFTLDDFMEDEKDNSKSNPLLGYVRNEKFIKIIANRLKGFEEKGLVTCRV